MKKPDRNNVKVLIFQNGCFIENSNKYFDIKI